MNSFAARIYAFKFADGFMLVYPLYALMFVEAGLSPNEIGVCLAAWSLTSFLLQIPAGVIADRFSRRAILALAQAIRAAGYVIWLFYPDFWGFFAGFILWGIKSAFTGGTFEALVFDELKALGREADYTRIIGRTQSAGFIAILAASLGAALVIRLGFHAVIQASVAAGLIATILPMTLARAPRSAVAGDISYFEHLRLGLAQTISNRTLLGLVFFLSLVLALGGTLDEFFSILGAKAGLTKPLVALLIGAMSAGQAIASALAHRVRHVATPWLYALFALGGGFLAVTAWLFQPWAMGLLIVFSAVFKVIDVIWEGRMQPIIPDETRATIGSVRGFLVALAVTLFSLGFGPLAQATSYRTAFLLTGFAIIAAGLAYLLQSLWRSLRPQA